MEIVSMAIEEIKQDIKLLKERDFVKLNPGFEPFTDQGLLFKILEKLVKQVEILEIKGRK